MNPLLKKINEHKEKNNISVCYHLYAIILQHNINTEEELLNLENKLHITDEIKVRNEIKYNAFLSDITHFEKLDANDLAKLERYEDLYLAESNDVMKTKYLILIYEINEWEMVFPYTAYKLIIGDMLN